MNLEPVTPSFESAPVHLWTLAPDPPSQLTLQPVNALEQIRQSYIAGIRPDTQLLVSEWADAHRILPKKSSAEPGPWRTSRTPYLREIMDGFSSTSVVQEIVFMKASQVAGTEAILNALGYVIDHAPGPALLVQPTVELAKRFSRQRLDPLLTDTPNLAKKVAESRSRDSGNTMLSKDFPGGQLVVTGANSAVGLRSMPAAYLFFDEVDAYPLDVDEEGSPIELAEARQRTFARRKTMKVSTPTIEGRSAIASAYEESDRRRYYVPCPACGEMQPLEFSRLVWTKLLLPPEDAVYECRACSYGIQDHEKTEMLAAGEWRSEVLLELHARRADAVAAGKPIEVDAIDEQIRGAAARKVRGYHLSALYSPVGWMSWGEIAVKFAKVHKDPEKHRVFVNTVLGEGWVAQGGEAPDWSTLRDRREHYTIGTIPMPAMLLTAGVDVQKDRLVYEVVGWGRGKRSWSIDSGELPGDTADIDRGPWGQLDALLERTYPHASGNEMPVRMMAIDSGYNTQTVYNYARKYPLTRVIAVKGRDEGGVLVGSPTSVEVSDRGRKLKRGGKVWPVCVSMVKSEFYGWLRGALHPESGEPAGYCHFPEYGDDYFKQLTAEQLVMHKTRKGFVRTAWELIPGRANHMLDARVYARAAAFVAGLDRFQEADWRSRELMLGVPPPAPPSVAPPPGASAVPAPLPPAVRPRRLVRSVYIGR